MCRSQKIKALLEHSSKTNFEFAFKSIFLGRKLEFIIRTPIPPT